MKKPTQAEWKINDLILKSRIMFIMNDITQSTMAQTIKELFILDTINHKPIRLYINSRGGSVSDGFALIDCISFLQSPIETVIIGEACSMGGLISIVGNSRYMTKNSFWMGHDMRGGIWGDYSEKVEYRADYIKKCWNMIESHLKKYTKLTAKDLLQLRNGELWLNPDECLQKGIIDKIIQ